MLMQRINFIANRVIDTRIAKPRRRIDGEVEQQSLHTLRVVQDFFSESGNGGQSFGINALPDAPPQRRHRVIAKIEAIMTKNPLRQQLDLDPFEIVLAALVG